MMSTIYRNHLLRKSTLIRAGIALRVRSQLTCRVVTLQFTSAEFSSDTAAGPQCCKPHHTTLKTDVDISLTGTGGIGPYLQALRRSFSNSGNGSEGSGCSKELGFARGYSANQGAYDHTRGESGEAKTHVTWLDTSTVSLINKSIMGEDPGGKYILYDESLLRSSTNRPQHIYHYAQIRDLYTLAAHYTEAVAHSHCFFNGNKRTAMLAGHFFLRKNGIQVLADDRFPDLVVGLVTGKSSVDDLAGLLRSRSSFRGGDEMTCGTKI